MNETQAHLNALEELSAEFFGLSWCLIKWPDDDRQHGDLDVLVADKYLPAMERAAEYCGFRYDPDPDEYRRKYIKEENNHLIELDIHTEAAWVGIKYLDKGWILRNTVNRRVGKSMVRVPSAEADLLIWAAHDIRSNHIPKHDVSWCLKMMEVADLYECRAIADYNNWLYQFDRFLQLIMWLEDKPDSYFPYSQSKVSSLRCKLDKAIGESVNNGIKSGLSELNAIRKFDL